MCNELDRIAFCIWRIIDSHLSPTSSFIFCSTSFEQSYYYYYYCYYYHFIIIIIIIIIITVIIIITIII